MNNLPKIYEDFLYNLEFAYKKSDKTLRAYRINLKDFNDHLFNGSLKTSLEDIKQLRDEDILIRFLRVKESEGMSGASLNSRVSTIRSFYKWLVHRGDLTLDVSRNLPSFKRNTKVCTPLNFEECKQLLDNVRNKMLLNTNYETTKMNLILSILVGAGLRIEELHYLEISDFDRENKCLHLTKTKFGKERSVSIPEQILEDLDIYLEYRLPLNNRIPLELSDCLFISKRRNRLSVDMMRISIYKEYEELGFADKDIHSLRKSYITNMIDAGCPVHEVSKQVGHTNINTTLNTYYKPEVKDTSKYNKLFNSKNENNDIENNKKENKKIIKIDKNVIQLQFGSNVI